MDLGRALMNTRLAYVAISRAWHHARVYTNDATTLGERFAQSINKTAAVEFPQPTPPAVGPAQQLIQRTPAAPKQYRQPMHNPAVQAFRHKDLAKGEELLTLAGRVHLHETSNDRITAIVSEYKSRADRAVIHSPDEADRKRLTHRIRDELKASGHLASRGPSSSFWCSGTSQTRDSQPTTPREMSFSTKPAARKRTESPTEASPWLEAPMPRKIY